MTMMMTMMTSGRSNQDMMRARNYRSERASGWLTLFAFFGFIFVCFAPLAAPQMGPLCAISTLVLNRLTSGTLYPDPAYLDACVRHGLAFILNALRIKPKMLAMLRKTLLNLFVMEDAALDDSPALRRGVSRVRTALLREMGVLMSSFPAGGGFK